MPRPLTIEDRRTSESWNRWITAYCALRGLGPLEAVGEGRYLETGRRVQSGRLFLNDFDPAALARVIARTAEPAFYVEFPADAKEVRPFLPADWTFGDPAYLMAKTLGRTDGRAVPEGFSLTLDVQDCTASARIFSGSGSLAATGSCLVLDREAVFDQIVTEAPYRRRKLATTIVAVLECQALSLGATHGMLVATAEGKVLYERIGWDIVSEITTIISPIGERSPDRHLTGA